MLSFTRPLLLTEMTRIPAPIPEGLSRLLERNIGFLAPALWIAFLSRAIDSRRAWEGQRLFRRSAPIQIATKFFPRKALARRHIPSALMALWS